MRGTALLLALPIAVWGLVEAHDRKQQKRPPRRPPPGPSPAPSPPPTPEPMPAPTPAPTPSEPAPSGSFLAAMDEEWSQHREEQVRSAMLAGLFDPMRYEFVISEGAPGTPREGYRLEIPVMRDAFSIEGVRIEGTYETAQRLADWLHLTMMTPYVAGLISAQSDAPIQPVTLTPATATKAQMIQASRMVDERLRAFPGWRLMRNAGKDWVLTARLLEAEPHPSSHVAKLDSGPNHGLFVAAWEPIQNVGTFHGWRNHTDYTEVLRFTGPEGTLVHPDGTREYVATKPAVMDSFLAPFLTGEEGRIYGKQVGEGVLPFDRHPSIPYQPPPVPVVA